MANKLRNEVDVMFAGKKRTMRATIECVTAIEDEAGKGIIRVIDDFVNKNYRLKDSVSVIYHGLQGAGGELSVDDVAREVVRLGINRTWDVAVPFLHSIMGGDDEEEGKPKALEAAPE